MFRNNKKSFQNIIYKARFLWPRFLFFWSKLDYTGDRNKPIVGGNKVNKKNKSIKMTNPQNPTLAETADIFRERIQW